MRISDWSSDVCSSDLIAREMARFEKVGAAYLFLDDPAYPPLLAALDDAPAALTWRGDLSLAARTTVAMVGARNASAAACRFARQIASELVREEVAVISGLARGIDTAAHVGALGGGTIAVIAGGLDIAYPPENAELQERIDRKSTRLNSSH